MGMKGFVIGNESKLELTGPTELSAIGTSYFRAKSKVTLSLAFEIKIDELSTSSHEEVHKLAMEISEEINRRLK